MHLPPVPSLVIAIFSHAVTWVRWSQHAKSNNDMWPEPFNLFGLNQPDAILMHIPGTRVSQTMQKL